MRINWTNPCLTLRTGRVRMNDSSETLTALKRLRVMMIPTHHHLGVFVCLMCFVAVGEAQSPVFCDNFNMGKLDASKWVIANRKAPGNIEGVNDATVSPDNVIFSPGMLRIQVAQVQGPKGVISTGGQIESKQSFGYGTYAFTMRMGSTSSTPDGIGSVVSGSVSSGFTFVNNSETELDIEFLGSTPDQIWLTNWRNPNPAITPSRDFRTYDKVSFQGLADGFHKYKIVWIPGSVKWYIDCPPILSGAVKLSICVQNQSGARDTAVSGVKTV